MTCATGGGRSLREEALRRNSTSSRPIGSGPIPYYQEFLRPHGLLWWAGVNVRAGDNVLCLALQRSIAAGPFVGQEIALLAASAPKLSSAIAVAAALGNEKVQASLASFEACATPVMLFDWNGRISALNRSAEALLGRDLWLHERRLVSWKRDVTIALGRALHVLSWDKDGPASETPIVIPRIKGRPIIAYPSRLPGVTNDFFTSVRMILILHDTASRPPTMPQVLAATFGLSPAEGRLASRIGRGEDLKDIAEAEGIVIETARARLKAVFAKTGTHRQAELAILVAGLSR